MIKKKLLITGGNGFIGSVLAKNLEKFYKIFIIDIQKNIFLDKKKFKTIYQDLSNKKMVNIIIKNIKPEIIIHLAAQSTVDFINKKKNLYIKNNILVTNNIVDAAEKFKIKKFIFASSASVYGNGNGKNIFDEESKLSPNNLYGKTKLINELTIKKKFEKTFTRYCILRFFNVCSSDLKNCIGEFHSPETHLLPIIINKIHQSKNIYIYGKNYNTKDGTSVRDYIHILDVVAALKKSIVFLDKNKNGIFNLGTKNGFSVLQLTKLCLKKIKSNTKIKFLKKRTGDNPTLICNINKARNILKWKAKNSSINKIISDEIHWFKILDKKKLFREFIY
jgi:UDP-glucose 4-epimerase